MAAGGGEIINVDFEGRQADDSDENAIHLLLKDSVLSKTSINLDKLTDQIIRQNYIGCVLAQPADELEPTLDSDDEDDMMGSGSPIFSVTSCINCNQSTGGNDISSQIHEMLRSEILTQSDDIKIEVQKLLDTSSLGWVIVVRYSTLPDQVAPALYLNLLKDIEAAKRKDMPYQFDWYLSICKIYTEDSSSGRNPSEASERFFLHGEDELYHDAAKLTFSVSLDEPSAKEDGLTAWTHFMFLPAKDLNTLVKKMEEKFNVQ